MRQIKFMGKTKDGDWVHGYYFRIKDMCFICSYNEKSSVLVWHAVIPESVGQFTGLIIYGEEVYEGHILSVDEGQRIVLVTWFAPRACFDTEFLSSVDINKEFKKLENNQWSYRCKIIGTVTDNPELMK